MRSYFKGIKLILFFMWFILLGSSFAKDLTVSVAELPLLSETPDKGIFIDLLKAFDEVYSEGDLTIKIYPFARSIDNAVKGDAEFHMPMIRNPEISDDALPFNYSTTPYGLVTIVAYTNKNKKITAKMLKDALKNGGTYPYIVNVARGMENLYTIPTGGSNSVEIGLMLVNSGRADVFLHAQEEADFVIREKNLKNIHREFYKDFDAIFIIPKGEKGRETDKILTTMIERLDERGDLQSLYSKSHVPYIEWQPYEE